MANGKDSWKNWLIAALWTVTLILGGFGYNSIKDSLDKNYNFQVSHSQEWANWKIEYTNQQANVWRAIDRICSYQAERLMKEGRVPNYNMWPDKVK